MKSLVALTFLLPGLCFADGPRLIPFQGHLTRPSPSDPAEYDVLFTLYTAPAGGESKVWGPERHENIAVVNGLVNTIIGSVEPLPDAPADFFARPLYVGITIDVDGNPATPDLELVPRQVWLPAVHAIQSTNAAEAALLDGHNWGVLLDGGETDPAEEGAQFKRSLMNLPPDTTSLPGFVREAGLDEEVALGKLVEVVPGTNMVRLTYDRPGYEDSLIRGMYLGMGRIATSGFAQYAPGGLTIGAGYYVDPDPSRKGLLTSTIPSGLRKTYHIFGGVATSTTEIQLALRRVLLTDTFIEASDRGNLLFNYSFSSEYNPAWTGWYGVNNLSNPNCPGQPPCCGMFVAGAQDSNQDILLTDAGRWGYLYDAIDSNAVRAVFGALGTSNGGSAVPNPDARILLTFKDESDAPISTAFLNFNSQNNCTVNQTSTCLPAGTRKITFRLEARSGEDYIFEECYFSLTEAVTAGPCP